MTIRANGYGYTEDNDYYFSECFLIIKIPFVITGLFSYFLLRCLGDAWFMRRGQLNSNRLKFHTKKL